MIHAHVLILELRVDERADQRGSGPVWYEPVAIGMREPIFIVAFWSSVARMRGTLQNLRIVVGQQQIQRGRADAHGEVRGVQVRQVIEGWADCGAGAAGRAGGCAAARARCRAGVALRAVRLQRYAKAARPRDAQRAFPVLAHFKYGDVDHDFAARLVEIVDELLRQQQFVGRGAHHDGVLALHAVDLGVGHHVAQRGLHIIQIVLLPGIGQIEGLHRLLIQLLALGPRVLRHKDGVAGDGPPEGVDMTPTMRSASSSETLFRSTWMRLEL